MKYLKSFENLQNIIKYGYYVTIKTPDDYHSIDYNEFLKYHIGRVELIDGDFRLCYIYVNFIFNNNDTKEIRTQFNYLQPFNINKVDLYAPTLEELKIKIKTKKYNL